MNRMQYLMGYNIFLTLLSFIMCALIPGFSIHTSIASIVSYLYFTFLIVIPVAIWSLFFLRKKYQFITPIQSGIASTLFLVITPYLAAEVGYKMKEKELADFEKLKKTIVVDGFHDYQYLSTSKNVIGITIEFLVKSPEQIRLYPQITIAPISQPVETYKPRYPDFRYYHCSIKNDKGKVIARPGCKDMHPTAYQSINWPVLSKDRRYTFSISMVPENCMSAAWYKQNPPSGFGKPFTSEDYGLGIAVKYRAVIQLFRRDGYFILEKTHLSNMSYKPRDMYQHLSEVSLIECI